ncbi:MAG TPA: lipid II flippase MurJ, partial [Candidatus Cloacimonadota bacterium]|nr:lipid II flippase MurJ [Candidatus Cloacimonadota bacterium]
YGNRLMQLPLGIFAISAGTAVLPLYSRFASQDKPDDLSQSMKFSTITLAYLILPITVIILALGKDFMYVLFQSGEFDSVATENCFKALFFYSLGLMFYSLNQVVTPVFYAYKDTKTPVMIAAPMVVLNITLNWILMKYMSFSGLAFATSLTAVVNFVVLLALLKKKVPQISFAGIFSNLFKAALISILIYFILFFANSRLPELAKIPTLVKDGILSLSAFLIFYGLGLLFKLEYLAEMRKNLWNRLARR